MRWEYESGGSQKTRSWLHLLLPSIAPLSPPHRTPPSHVETVQPWLRVPSTCRVSSSGSTSPSHSTTRRILSSTVARPVLSTPSRGRSARASPSSSRPPRASASLTTTTQKNSGVRKVRELLSPRRDSAHARSGQSSATSVPSRARGASGVWQR
jgi:hypothetical protein